MIIVIDFGSQTAHLIARRVRDLGAPTTVVTPETALTEIKKLTPNGIIFSGGPASVYADGAPTIDKEIFKLKIPILAICYGQQLTAYLLGGSVKPGKIKEYGPATLKINHSSLLFTDLSPHSRIWMSHGDTVMTPPPGFVFTAQTNTIAAGAMENVKTNIYCVQFHPEVEHTEHGNKILNNFLTRICHVKLTPITHNLDEMVSAIKQQIGSHKAIAAVSGGVDSSVAAALVAKAIGKQLIPLFVDNGLMRLGTKELITTIFKKHFHVTPIIIDTQKETLARLKGITDPESKRKIIGNHYIEVFEQCANKYTDVQYLIQGTIYSDVIESKGTKHADKIKSHHNVGGLPEKMRLKLVEPVRNLYKDEVRSIGKQLGIPQEFLNRQPFPGPGQAIRIIGEITKARLDQQQQTDQIVLEEIKRAGVYNQVFQSFPISTGIKSTAVKGDGRFYGEVMALRIYDSSDIMTASWSRLPYDVLQTISSRIVNEVPGVSRVVYDITTKPPATMEWE